MPRATACLENSRADAFPVVANQQLKLPLIIAEIDFDPARVCMRETITNRFTRDAIDLLGDCRRKLLCITFDIDGKSGTVLRSSGGELFSEPRDRLSDVRGKRC